MLEQREIKLSRVVSAFAREALTALPSEGSDLSMLDALGERVDTLLMMTDLCRSGFLQEQQVSLWFNIAEPKSTACQLQPQPYLVLR